MCWCFCRGLSILVCVFNIYLCWYGISNIILWFSYYFPCCFVLLVHGYQFYSSPLHFLYWFSSYLLLLKNGKGMILWRFLQKLSSEDKKFNSKNIKGHQWSSCRNLKSAGIWEFFVCVSKCFRTLEMWFLQGFLLISSFSVKQIWKLSNAFLFIGQLFW